MSDKSFGDHTNRNIVKNPLLSSAVTGLSLEDLTHKAVLLPVSQSLDQISRSDQQQGTQARTLAHPQHDTPIFLSGDALSNIPLSNTPKTSNQNVLDSKKNVNLEENRDKKPTTQSKAPAKSDDDFDVNEYIARLQGTRYVSAPLHSHLKEDTNANLEATEENLEEINLNESIPTETHQSLTADIAQNFSQLPTVLPHVASAVFSSFSNMLNYKNRDQTLDKPNVQIEQKQIGYDEVQFQRPDEGVPLMGVEENRAPKEVAPPPKEPSGGASNFRITTKKKYAQIPGLSSGDAVQSMTYQPGQNFPPTSQMPPIGHNIPTISQNIPPSSQSMPQMGQSMLPMSQNIPPLSQNMPPMGQSMPLMGQNITPLSQNVPPIGRSMPPMGQNIPPLSQNMPPMGQNMPPMSRNMPPLSQNLPYMSQNLPQMGENVPQIRQNMPPTSQSKSVGQGIPPMDQNMPSTRQNIPSFQSSYTQHEQLNLIQKSPFSVNVPTENVPHVSQSISNIGHNAPSVEQTMPYVQTMPSVAQNMSLLDPSNAQENPTAIDDALKSQGNTDAAVTTQYNIFNPAVENQRETKQDEQASEIQPNLFATQSSNFFTPIEQREQNVPANPTAIIPPPPMFSNLTRKDSQSSAGKSFLPPSVARRISANQPIIKPTTSTPSIMENLFVPAPVADATEQVDNSFSSASSAFVSAYGSSIKSESATVTPLNSTTPATYFTPSIEENPSSNVPISFLTQKTPAPANIAAASIATATSTLPPTLLSLGPTPSHILSSHPPASSSFILESIASTSQNVPPPMFQSPPQNMPPTFFSPQESSSSNAPHPITQMPPIASEPPKPVAEPPKATGAVNFRMTKKRPQYYAGPIVGVGAISNNIKPVIAPVISSALPKEGNFQGALLTPEQPAIPSVEQYAAPNIDQASVPFDINKPMESCSSQTSFDISKPQELTYGTTFNMGQPESHNYEQEYNTPFDTSRGTNDPYDEPKDSKGFGIIGTLKSKLSSIDINKIQNTVTTFFDPAYNDTKVAESTVLDNVPYQEQQQFGQTQQGQNNFDIFVPSPEYNQYTQYKHIGFDYSHNNQFYETQDPYMQCQSQNQDMSSYSTSSYFTDPNYSTEQVHSSNPLYDNTQNNYPVTSSYNIQENIPENVERLSTENSNIGNTTFFDPNAFTQQNLSKPSIGQEMTSQNKDQIKQSLTHTNQQNENYFDPNAPLNMTNLTTLCHSEQNKDRENRTSVLGSEASNMTYYNPNAYENRQIWEPQQSYDNSVGFTQAPYDQPKKNIDDVLTKEGNQTPMFYNPNAFPADDQQRHAHIPPTAFESNIQESSHKKPDISANAPNIQSDVRIDSQSTCDSALNTSKYNISNIQNQTAQSNVPPLLPAASFFDNPVLTPPQLIKSHETDINTPPVLVTKDTSLIEQKEPTIKHTAVTPLPIGSKSQNDLSKIGDDKIHKVETEQAKETSLIESLSKQEIPVLGVSTVPLFGLSTMIAEKSKSDTETELKTQPFDITQKPKSLIEEYNAASFFENVRQENRIISESQLKSTPLGMTALTINDVKNVLVIEPPQENIGTLLKRNASSSKLETLSTQSISDEYVKQQSNEETSTAFQESKIFFKHSDITMEQKDPLKITGIELDDNSELNICETCREVDTPEHGQKHEKPEDLTTQLIENITSRMQLSHPLTVPLPESDASMNKLPPYDQQLDEITQVAEETFETLQVQSATELLDKPVARSSEIRDYGWVTQEDVEPATAVIDHDYTSKLDSDSTVSLQNYGLSLSAPLSDRGIECEFKLDPNSIGFFGSSSLFSDNMPVPNNASDEIKAEIKHSHEDIVLPRQQSIPTAPPEEEIDPKLEEPGVLDVHSIEQDAKKDFPLEEEFIIEPSTDDFLSTDDDKIEFRERKRSSEDSTSNDTFTNRVEKFKKKIDDDSTEHSDRTPYTSPPISMASYFDTGNYAVESHYRNSFVSMRIPPGFEEEFARKLSGVSLSSDKTPEPNIPETSTQTKTSNTCTYMSANDGIDNIIGSESRRKDNIEAYAQAYAESKTEAKILSQNTKSLITSDATKPLSLLADTNPKQQIFTLLPENKAQESKIQAIGNTNTEAIQSVSTFSEIKPVQLQEKTTQNVQSLPDPMNFFSANVQETKAIEPAAAESFNRLASYFSMPPPQPDHSKSFFELSQSQNHYKHDPKHQEYHQTKIVYGANKNNHIDDDTKNNIKELMRDLTSPQNIQTNIARTVNYFTVELDNDVNKHTTNANPINVKSLDENLGTSKNIDLEKKGDIKDRANSKDKKEKQKPEKGSDFLDIKDIMNCKYCNRLIPGINSKSFVVKSAVNDSTETKNNESTMSKQNETSDGKKNSVNFAADFDVEKQAEDNVIVLNEHRGESEYTPVKHHWFYRVDVEEKSVWRGFSAVDSNALEEAYHSPDLNESTLVATDGGRYDVNIVGRLRIAVYWKEKPTNVRRCSWFYKGTTDARYVPYTEAVAEKLEEEYRHGVTTGEWHRKLILPNSEMVIMHGPTVMIHFLHSGATDAFSTPPSLLGKRMYRNPLKIRVARDQREKIDHLILLVHGAGEFKRRLLLDQATSRPRVVRRSHEESEIEESEPSKIDHLLLLCHGVGSACDMRFRSVEEVVEDFRSTSLQLLQSHYRNSYDNGVVSRVEVLPISWHEQLHSGETGVDKRLACLTLDSIPRLRAFTNHTVLDVLFYTSPVFHQTIIDTVCSELNRVYKMFRERNPHFHGEVSLGGHSLGSVILYDLLCNQVPESPTEQPESSSRKSYVSETAAAGQLSAKYPRLEFPPAALYALGSPIAIFECIRGVQSLGKEFALPTCKKFFNIFHPYDPIAYRIEPLIDPQLQEIKPSQIPHHKGRKRMHLELKDTMARVGADLKQKLLESLRTTWNKWKSSPPTDGQLEKVVEEEMEKEQLCEDNEPANELQATPEMLGRLNCGRRVDYVLQEAPLEMINEYLFAMSSHVGYWESEDTMLLMLREIYSSLDVQPDSTVPQQTMTVQRTKTPAQDECGIINETSDIPSTSRGST